MWVLCGMEVKSLDSPYKLPHIIDNPAMLVEVWFHRHLLFCLGGGGGGGGSGFMFVFRAEGFGFSSSALRPMCEAFGF